MIDERLEDTFIPSQGREVSESEPEADPEIKTPTGAPIAISEGTAAGLAVFAASAAVFAYLSAKAKPPARKRRR